MAYLGSDAIVLVFVSVCPVYVSNRRPQSYFLPHHIVSSIEEALQILHYPPFRGSPLVSA